MHDLPPLRQLLQKVGTQLNMELSLPPIMQSIEFEDNNGDLVLDTPPRKNPRTRNIAVKYHFSRENVGEGKGIMIQRV